MKHAGPRHIRLRTVVTYPAVLVAVIVALALAVTAFGPSQVAAVADSATLTPISTDTPTSTVTPSPTTSPATTMTPTTPTTTTSETRTPDLALPAGAAFDDHHVLARIEGPQLLANYLPVDETVLDATPFQTFRVRFRLHNAGTAPITVTPWLEFRSKLGSGFAVVPAQPELGIPLHLNREWVPALGHGGGTMQGPLGEDIALADFRIGKEGGLALVGHRSMGANPDRSVTLPSDSYTEQEFTITLSIDAKYLTDYELRITNGGNTLTGTDVATIRLGAPPAVKLSPGQHQGLAVPGPQSPIKSTSRTGVAK